MSTILFYNYIIINILCHIYEKYYKFINQKNEYIYYCYKMLEC